MAITAPDVNPQPIQSGGLSVETTPTTFGGGPGVEQEVQTTQRLSGDIGEIATFEKIRADQTAVDDAQSKALALKQQVLYDPETGVLGSKGTDSIGAHQEGITKLQHGLNDISSGLNGDQQIGPFNKWAQGLAATANQTMMSHVDKEMADHRTDVFNSTVENSSASAALEHGNPQAVDFYRNTANQAALNYARDNRLDPDQTKQLVQDTNDKVQIGVINGMLKFQTYDDAQKYLESNKENISPKAQQVIANTMEEGLSRHQALVAANDAMSKNPNSESDSLAALNKIQNPESQELARKIVSQKFAQDRQAVKNDQDTTFMQTLQMLNQKGLVDSAARRLAVPEATWNKLSPEQQRAIEKGGAADETSISKWEDFTKAVADKSIGNMSQAEINSKFMPYMTVADQKTVADYWSGMKQNKGQGTPKQKMYETVLQMQDQALVGIGALSPKSPTRSQLIFKKQFQDSIDRDLEVQQNALGRPLKQDEIQKVVDHHALQVVNGQSAGLIPESFKSYPYDKIPDVSRQHIISLARDNGFTATKANIEEAYKLHKQGKTDDEIAKALK